jgi:hypothetical protein
MIPFKSGIGRRSKDFMRFMGMGLSAERIRAQHTYLYFRPCTLRGSSRAGKSESKTCPRAGSLALHMPAIRLAPCMRKTYLGHAARRRKVAAKVMLARRRCFRLTPRKLTCKQCRAMKYEEAKASTAYVRR